MVLAMGLMTQLGVETSMLMVTIDMVILGLGLGMIMQVLILAAQNSVEPRDVGVATAASTLFRQVGGSIGLSVFGALFANRLAAGMLTSGMPAEAIPGGTFSPAAVAALPAALRLPVQEVFVNSLHIVFLVAAVIGVVAFALALFVEERPLRSAPGRNADNAEPAAAHI